MRTFERTMVAAATLLASLAFATGEKVTLVPANNPLRETLCISMECVESHGEVTVAVTPMKGGAVEVTVTAQGQRRLTQVAQAVEGQLSSTEVVRVTSLVLKAIEAPQSVDQPKATVKTARAVKAKAPRPKLLAHR